jgi:WD40 repeat protein
MGFGLRFTPDGRQLLVADWRGEMTLWDIATGTHAWQFGPNTDVQYSETAFSPDGKSFAMAGWVPVSTGTEAYLYDSRTGNEIWGTALPYAAATGGIAVDYSLDGSLIALATNDDSVWLLDAHSGAILRQVHVHDLNGVRFSPDGRTFVTSGADKIARLWQAATGQEIRQFVGHTDAIMKAAFSPDGKQIVTASHDGTLGVWDAATGQLLRHFISDALGNEDVAWSPDGKLLASVGDSAVAKLWDGDYHTTIAYLCGQLQRDLTGAERAQYNITDSSPTCGK